MLTKAAMLTAALCGGQVAQAFYLPGVNPHSFTVGQDVKMKVNKMTSVKEEYPIEYYRLPFCQPDEGIKLDHENLGEFLTGDRIENSPYRLKMKTDMYCEQVCATNLGRTEVAGVSPSKIIRAIRRGYHNNWIVDNLPSASKSEDESSTYTRYFQGFPIGFVDAETKLSYINNHVNIELEYHQVESLTAGEKEYRIVRFTVEPFSIQHEFTPTMDDDDGKGDEFKVATIEKPIKSCDPNAAQKVHTNFHMVTHSGHSSQPASGKVLFTYDVIWKENTEVSWASRWDIYLSMNDAFPDKIHWLSVGNSLIIVLVLTTMVAAILVRNLRRDYDRYSKVSTSDEERNEDLEETGWKLVHADVFRPPNYPMMISVFSGTGLQLLGMALFTLIFAVMGFLNPARRGSLVLALLLLYVILGSVAGYTTARMYKTFKGKNWQRATFVTAFGFPTLTFALFFLMNLLAISKESSDAVPFSKMIILLLLWFGVSTPLVFFGAYMGFKVDAIEFPVNTSNIPRQVPDQPWFMGAIFTALVGGIMPFGACFLELFFIMSSIWMDQYYYVFGFLFLTFVILMVTVAEITVLFNYFQLCGEDYHWWWRSYINGGATAFYVYWYSFQYFQQLQSNSVATYILYFGYMGLVSFGLFLICGSVGTFSCLWFNKMMFGSIKID